MDGFEFAIMKKREIITENMEKKLSKSKQISQNLDSEQALQLSEDMLDLGYLAF